MYSTTNAFNPNPKPLAQPDAGVRPPNPIYHEQLIGGRGGPTFVS